MKNIFYFFMILIFLLTSGFSADINATIVNGNTKTFQLLLNQVSKDRNQTEEISLEKTLLQELLKPNKEPTLRTFTLAKDDTSYKKLFLTYLDDIKLQSKTQNILQESQKKIITIESEIKTLPQHAPSLLSNQLQDAYYHQKVHLLQKQSETIEQELQQLKTLLVTSLGNIHFNQDDLHKVLKEGENKATAHLAKINKLNIVQEQASLISDKNRVSSIQKQLQSLQKAYHDETKELLADHFLLFSAYVKSKNDKAFIEEKQIRQLSTKYQHLTEDEVDNYLSPLLLSLEKKYIGQIKTLTGASKQEIEDILYQGWKFINEPIFTINDTAISIFKMVWALLIFIFGFIVGALYKRKINKIASNRRSFTPSTRTILANLGYYLIVTIAFFMALNILGVKLSSIALVAGALSVGIGFGLQNIVSNFVSGLILMFERSVKIGDYIEVDENTRGYVTDIRMRSTTINTNENIDIIIPNQSFIQNNVINWTMSDNIRRFSIPFGVAYGTDVHMVINVIKEAVLNSDLREDIVENSQRQTRVIMTEMADSSVNFELFVWVRGDKLHKPKRTASEFLVVIYDTLYANQIEIPFPQQDIHIRSIENDIPILTKKEFK